MPTAIRKRGYDKVQEIVSGQGGTIVPINESSFTTDEAILDPNSPLAVQIPEGVGADHSLVGLEYADSLAEGHVEAKFGTVAAPSATLSDRTEEDQPDAEFKPDWDRVESPDVHNTPELQRVAEEKGVDQDVEAESPASSKTGDKDVSAETKKSKAARADAKADAAATN